MCRYYFLRQSDKKGFYFYRDSIANTGTPLEEYGRWRLIKELDIRGENTAPGAGCASFNDICFIPCEGANDVKGGTVRYFKGMV